MSTHIDLSSITPGFQDPMLESQAAFRRILDAMSRPGTPRYLEPISAPTGLNAATAVIALTLLDFETPVWLSPDLRSGAAAEWMRFHCNCPLVDEPADAAFAIVGGEEQAPDLGAFNPGDAKYPDRSTTIVFQLPSLDGGAPKSLVGPGIETTAMCAPTGLPDEFWLQWAENAAKFQFGVDVMLTADNALIGLPRTSRVAGPHN